MKRVLLTGFGPFLDFKINPSQLLVEDLSTSFKIPNLEVISQVLPVAYDQWERILFPFIQSFQPHLILSFGVQKKKEALFLEFAGRNLAHSERPDIYGKVKSNAVLEPHGPQFLSTPLPLSRIKKHLSLKGYPVEISYSAGSYLCNCQYYKTLYFLKSSNLPVPMGFIHIPPFLPHSQEQGEWNFEKVKEGAAALVRFLLFGSSS
ncbi:MAG: hypothetical protein D6785_16490 [Planctomycetota bacterium]|nr:MAG: hypothetical protein D6785_16490 [Planctomycetota bacterium]